MEEYMTIKDVSKLIKYHEATIRIFVRSGQLKAYRRRAKQSELRFKLADIEAFMEGKTRLARKKKLEKRK